LAIFTAAATWLLAGTFLAGSAIATSVLAAGLGIAASIGLNYVAQALSGTEAEPDKKEHFGIDGRLSAGGAIPRSFGIGTHVSAGSLVYANYWGYSGETPNAYLTQVIAVSDMPREQLLEVWVQGEKCTLRNDIYNAEFGAPLNEYLDAGGAPHLWIKFYDGTQVAADPFLTSRVSSPDRPYGSSRIGTGICYVIATALVEEKLFSGFPTFKFVLSGIPLYDPSKDSTNGGSGAHRYSDPATWGGDGDQLPAVQAYNILAVRPAEHDRRGASAGRQLERADCKMPRQYHRRNRVGADLPRRRPDQCRRETRRCYRGITDGVPGPAVGNRWLLQDTSRCA
jgi:hypothetical protein